MVVRDVCPRCQSPKYKKNSHIHNGKQNHQCHDCGRQFVDCSEQYLISEDTRALIERLLVERISLRGICRAVGVTLKWLVGSLVQCFEALPDHLNVEPVSRTQDVVIQRLEVEADERQSFVKKKENKQWMWIAMDAKTRQVIAFHVGDRSRRSAKRLWAKMPAAYRQHATLYTDQYVVYTGVIPAAQHRAISKLAGSVANFDFGAKSENRVSEIQWLTDSQTLEKANLRQNPNSLNSCSDNCTGMSVLSGFLAVVLMMCGPHVKKVVRLGVSRLLRILQEVRPVCKTRNQFYH